MYTILDTLERSLKGAPCETKKWDLKVIPGQCKKYLQKYGLEGTYDPENPICSDDSLLDQFYKAGWELAVDTGILNVTTERIIKVSDEELKEYIEGTPSALTLGTGADARTVVARKPEDGKEPLTQVGPFGNAVSEEMWIPIHQSLAQNRVVDAIIQGGLATAYGLEVQASRPTETLAGYLEAKLTKEAVRRAGRPGMPLMGVCGSVTEYGQFGGYAVPGGFTNADMPAILGIAELKTDNGLLQKAVQVFNAYGSTAPAMGGTTTIIGGYAGGPEGAALMAIADCLMYFITHQLTVSCAECLSARYGATTSREAAWACSVACAALARNTDTLYWTGSAPQAGSGEEMHLYETAVDALVRTTCGCSFFVGVKAAGGKYVDYTSPLENVFGSQIAKANAGMKRAEANEIVKRLIPKYEDRLKDAPKGKSFSELYDLKTLKPNKETTELYNKMRNEMEELGVKFIG